jgi:hypothetical protein
MRFWLLALLIAVSACGSSNKQSSTPAQCGKGAKNKVKKGARVAGSSAKAGATTAVEGVKTFGRAAGGLFSGGSSEAKREWKKGAADTDEMASEGADEVSAEADKDDCD